MRLRLKLLAATIALVLPGSAASAAYCWPMRSTR
jgi:hypothetical protein